MVDKFAIAQVCLNGHIINDDIERTPTLNEKFCSKCGQPTITHCPNCNQIIRGIHYCRNIPHSVLKENLTYCYNCGNMYPWTAIKIESLFTLICEDGELGNDDKNILKNALPELITDTPNTQLSKARIKHILPKCQQETIAGLKNVLYSLISTSIYKFLFS